MACSLKLSASCYFRMFALLWQFPSEFYNSANWSAEAEAGVHFQRIRDPSAKQEAKFIATEHSFMQNEWASERIPTGVSNWKRFLTSYSPDLPTMRQS